jgi:hypothetical protein
MSFGVNCCRRARIGRRRRRRRVRVRDRASRRDGRRPRARRPRARRPMIARRPPRPPYLTSQINVHHRLMCHAPRHSYLILCRPPIEHPVVRLRHMFIIQLFIYTDMHTNTNKNTCLYI